MIIGYPKDKMKFPYRAIVKLLLFVLIISSEAASQDIRTGTAFSVTSSGNFVSNRHVVIGCSQIHIKINGERRLGRVTAVSHEDDLALIHVPNFFTIPAQIRLNYNLQVGEDISVFGFPLIGLLSDSGIFSTGIVSALRGLHGDSRRIQISAPVQSGNSGSPVLDVSGNVVGVVQSKIDVARVFNMIGSLPEGISFAVSPSALIAFLERERIAYAGIVLRDAPRTVSPTSVAQSARRFVAIVECTNSLPSVRGDGRSIHRPLGEPPAIVSIAEIRTLYPFYSDMSDGDIAHRLRTRHYPELSESEFARLFFAGPVRAGGLPATRR